MHRSLTYKFDRDCGAVDFINSLVADAKEARVAGDLTYALECYHEVLRLRKAVMSDSNVEVASALISTSEIYVLLKKNDMAVLMSKQALSVINEYASKTFSKDVLDMLYSIGNIYIDIGRCDQAINIFKRQIDCEKLINGHVSARALLKLAEIYESGDEFREAIKMHTRALKIQRREFVHNVKQVSTTTKTIIRLYCRSKCYTDAIKFYDYVIFGRESNYDVICLADMQEYIGLAYIKNGDLDKALQTYKKAMYIKASIYGETHKDFAILLYKIASVYLVKGDDEEKSIAYYNRALKVQRSLDGANLADISLILRRMTNAYRRQGNLVVALRYLNEALLVEKEIHGNFHVSIAKIFNEMGKIYLERAQVREAKDCFIEASRITQQCGNTIETFNLDSLKFYELSLLHPEAAAVA